MDSNKKKQVVHSEWIGEEDPRRKSAIRDNVAETNRISGKGLRRPVPEIDGVLFGALAPGQCFEFDGLHWRKADSDGAELLSNGSYKVFDPQFVVTASNRK